MEKERRVERRRILGHKATMNCGLSPHDHLELELLDDVDALYDIVQAKNESIDRLEKQKTLLDKQIAWYCGEGHHAGCPQGWSHCKCGAPEPPDE